MRVKILFISLGLLFSIQVFGSPDSIATDTINNRIFILHRVEKSQGFYGIARQYKVDVNEVIAANPREGLFLEIGEIVLVPKGFVRPGATAPVNSIHQTHTVVAGETLYSIARQYGVKLDELKARNNLPDYNISAGQVLIVGKTSGILLPGERPGAVPGTTPGKQVMKAHNGVSLMKETGTAGWIDDTYLDSKKSLALHKTAPTGTVIKITNNQNSRSIYAKVIGTLPVTDNQDMIILISKSAADNLGARGQRFPVTINYAVTQ
jgi:LysM repeat protein